MGKYVIKVRLPPRMRLTEYEQDYVLSVLGCCYGCFHFGEANFNPNLKYQTRKGHRFSRYLPW